MISDYSFTNFRTQNSFFNFFFNPWISTFFIQLEIKIHKPFFTVSGVQLAQTDHGQFHFHRATLSSQIIGKVVLTLAKTGTLCITLCLHGVPITSKSHTPITLANISSINVVFIFRCSSSPTNPVYARRLDSSVLVCSLQVHHTDIQK
jgi:hypothetical protein